MFKFFKRRKKKFGNTHTLPLQLSKEELLNFVKNTHFTTRGEENSNAGSETPFVIIDKDKYYEATFGGVLVYHRISVTINHTISDSDDGIKPKELNIELDLIDKERIDRDRYCFVITFDWRTITNTPSFELIYYAMAYYNPDGEIIDTTFAEDAEFILAILKNQSIVDLTKTLINQAKEKHINLPKEISQELSNLFGDL